MTSTSFQQLILIILLLILPVELRAQEYKYEIGGIAGTSFYMGDANKSGVFKNLNPAFGGVFRYNANFRVAFKGNLAWAKVTGSTEGLDNVFPENSQATFDRNVVDLGGQMEFNFFPYSDKYAYMNTKKITPYVVFGLGITVATGGSNTFVGPNIPLGVGVKYKVKNRVNLGCEFTVRKLFGDNFEGAAILDDPYNLNSDWLKNNDWHSLFLLSVTWDFGPRTRPCNNIQRFSGF
ncbi:DUF6089 family protein [Massilibacteroides sp.]|uniref:type IX secretion system protein PorG n=1 Tax=Massilibacteroides sp. TaxID=2034766 RepID=UPI0026040CC1|nr:DUF6089 family protein [Massilibacteroides sp.]MDD4514867.1 DUF6089 family protein [Massilibacteroides sp.]